MPLKLSAVGLAPARFRVGAFGSDHEDRTMLPPIARDRASAFLGRDVPGDRLVIIGDTPADVDCIFSPVLFDQDGSRTASELDPGLDTQTLWLAWQLPQTGGCLWRRTALERIGGWNEATPCCQEFELYRRAIEAGLHFHFAPTANAVYRVWSEGTLCRKDPRQVIEVRTELYRGFVAWLRDRGSLAERHIALAGRACFEMARTLAKLDLQSAARYHDERLREQLIHLAGPAAPFSYRAAYRAFGFSFAERMASTLRRRAA